MLGAELCDQLTREGKQLVGTDMEVSILDRDALRDFASHIPRVDAIVNCSAYTAVDKAEDEKELAFAINADGVKNIATVAADLGAMLIHISTDYVFPGTVDRALTETDSTGPMSVYGASKLRGEELVRDTWNNHVIIRTAWLYGKHGNNFVYTMLRLMNTKDRITVVNDQFGSPTSTADLAKAILRISSTKELVPGTYHYSGKGRTTWFDFARRIQIGALDSGILEKKCDIVPVSSAEFPTRAIRPQFSLLDTGKIERQYKAEVRNWETALSDMLKHVEGSISNIRAHRNVSAAALDSAKKLAASGPTEFVPALCAASIQHLLLGLIELKPARGDKGLMKALADYAPFAFQSSEMSLMDELEESRNMFYAGGTRDKKNKPADEILKRCGALRDRIMSRTVLSI